MISPTHTGNIQRVAEATPDLQLREQIERTIVSESERLRHPAQAIERLLRFVEGSRAPSTLLSQWGRSPPLLATLLQALDIDSPAVEWLIDDPDSFESLRLSAGCEPTAAEIRDRILTEIRCLEDLHQVQSALRRFRRRELLRVAFGVELHGMGTARAQQQLTWVNDAIIVATLEFAIQGHQARGSTSPDLPVTVLAHGSYGSCDTDFATPCCLVCIASDALRDADSRSMEQEDYESWCRRLDRFREVLESFDPLTFVVHFPLHDRYPSGRNLALLDLSRWVEWAQVQGDGELGATLMLLRTIAGNERLGNAILEHVRGLVFDRYRSRLEQASLASFFRKIDRKILSVSETDTPWSNAMTTVLLAQREVETIVMYQQWIYGDQVSEVQQGTISSRIESLAKHGCLSDAEYGLLSQVHETARDCKIRLQIQAGCTIPASSPPRDPKRSEALLSVIAGTLATLRDATQKLHMITQQLRTNGLGDVGQGCEEADLVFDPNPDPDWASRILARYGFADLEKAVALVKELGVEDFRVLSTRRCRYYLANIAAKLLQRIGQTPTPDRTLENLAATCRSIGAKGVLWELFSLHQPSMDLYIRLCGTSPYLVGILTSNPGMVDELVDSLLLGRLPTESHLSRLLDELCRGAQDVDAIVRSFKSAMHLSIGVRDILGKESISETHRTLANVADVCLQQLIEFHFHSLVQRFGEPTLENGKRCDFAVVAMGKLGNREPNYHSDVSVLFVYEGAGSTRPIGPTRHPQSIHNDYFFQQLAQRFSQGVNRMTKNGRLFELKNWGFTPEPTANLAWPLDDFESAFMSAQNDTLARLQLLSARPFSGDLQFQSRFRECVSRILVSKAWTSTDTFVALRERRALEQSATERNLKRGPGGTMDIETMAQVLSLQHAQTHPDLVAPGTIDSIERLRRLELISVEDALRAKDAYNFLRGVESGLRLMNTKARHDLPEQPIDLARLAFGLHIPDAKQLLESCQHYRGQARQLLSKYVGN
jgi:[glutamine synthetase] adenylyltransferase / [glutamine synthetase]-adenylyl-L-tyrosine phosphorylase